MNIYVGNISRNATEADLKEAFEAHGAVASVAIIKDKLTGDSRGFGFVEMPNKEKRETKGGCPGWAVRPFLFSGGFLPARRANQRNRPFC